MRRAIVLMVLMSFLLNVLVPPSLAQTLMPAAGGMVSLSAPWQPPVLAGVKVFPKDPFRFDFILDPGNDVAAISLSRDSVGRDQGRGNFKSDANRLIKYFLASLTVPEKDMWVNLSPYEKDRIVPEAFGQTGMGRDLLAEDYLLKQITASLLYPEGETGKRFWAEVYRQAVEKYGTTDIPVDTFNKVWIVPAKAKVFTKGNTAYVVESRLKVMLDTDYQAMVQNTLPTRGHVPQNVSPSPMPSDEALNMKASQVSTVSDTELAKSILREVIIPILEKEVNEGRNFAQLRQIFNSLILATWFKRHLKESILGQVYMDRNKIPGVDIPDNQEKEKIWAQYVEAFKKGAYNYIKEEVDPSTGETVAHKYVSGGIEWRMGESYSETDSAELPQKQVFNIATRIAPSTDAAQTSQEAAKNAFAPLFETSLFTHIMNDPFPAKQDAGNLSAAFSNGGEYTVFTEKVWDAVKDIVLDIDRLSQEQLLEAARIEVLRPFNSKPIYQDEKAGGLKLHENMTDFLLATRIPVSHPESDYIPRQVVSDVMTAAKGNLSIYDRVTRSGEALSEQRDQLRKVFRKFYILMRSIKAVDDSSLGRTATDPDAGQVAAKNAFAPLFDTALFKAIMDEADPRMPAAQRTYDLFSDNGSYGSFSQAWPAVNDIVADVDKLSETELLHTAKEEVLEPFNHERVHAPIREKGLLAATMQDFLLAIQPPHVDVPTNYMPSQLLSSLVMLVSFGLQDYDDDHKEDLRVPFRRFYLLMRSIKAVNETFLSRRAAMDAFDPLFRTALFRNIMDDIQGDGASQRVYEKFSHHGTYSSFEEDVWQGVVDIVERIDALNDEDVIKEAEAGGRAFKKFNAQDKYQKAREEGLQVHEGITDFLQATRMVIPDGVDTQGLDYVPAQLFSDLLTALMGQLELFQMFEGDARQKRLGKIRSLFEDCYILLKAVKVVNDRLVAATDLTGVRYEQAKTDGLNEAREEMIGIVSAITLLGHGTGNALPMNVSGLESKTASFLRLLTFYETHLSDDERAVLKKLDVQGGKLKGQYLDLLKMARKVEKLPLGNNDSLVYIREVKAECLAWLAAWEGYLKNFLDMSNGERGLVHLFEMSSDPTTAADLRSFLPTVKDTLDIYIPAFRSNAAGLSALEGKFEDIDLVAAIKRMPVQSKDRWGSKYPGMVVHGSSMGKKHMVRTFWPLLWLTIERIEENAREYLYTLSEDPGRMAALGLEQKDLRTTYNFSFFEKDGKKFEQLAITNAGNIPAELLELDPLTGEKKIFSWKPDRMSATEGGTGLPAMFWAVKKLGARIGVENLDGKVQFTIDIPAADASEQSGRPEGLTDLGGIDFNSAKLALEEAGDQVKFDAAMDIKQFESIPGFHPMIMSITPIADLSVFLGVK